MIKIVFKLLNSPMTLLVGWVVFLISPISGVLRLHILSDSNFSKFHVSGLSTILYYAPFILSVLVLIIIGTWFREFTIGRLNAFHKKVFVIISVLSTMFLLVCQYLLNLEASTYPNFLYQHYGIILTQLQLMSFVVALQLMMLVAFYVYQKSSGSVSDLIKAGKINNKKTPKSFAENTSLLLSVVGILSIFILSGSTFFSLPILNRESREGYVGKVGVDYKYMEFIFRHTPDNVMVIHPPQGDEWPSIGNQPVLRYFLFPRILVSGALVTTESYAHQLGEVYFVVVDPGGDREWPQINFRNKSVVFDQKDPIKYKNLTVFYEDSISKIYKIDF